jgi:hypothetical protein
MNTVGECGSKSQDNSSVGVWAGSNWLRRVPNLVNTIKTFRNGGGVGGWVRFPRSVERLLLSEKELCCINLFV